jgi:membrane protease YdiL (CAAX protease family)
LAFPTLANITISVVIFLVGAPIAYLSSRALKLSPKPIVITNPKREVRMASLVIGVVVVATFLVNALYVGVVRPLRHLGTPSPYYFDSIDVLWYVFFYAVWFAPLVIIMRRTKQNRATIGISKENIGRMLVLGLTLSAVYFVVEGFLAPSLGGGFNGFSPSLVYALMANVIVGFSEETVWRGYIQTRLAAYGGKLKGLVVTSILFALLHFSARSYQFSGAPLEALASSLLLFPLGLLFGYVMLRCQNVIPSSVFHLLSNWSAVFWQIPSF